MMIMKEQILYMIDRQLSEYENKYADLETLLQNEQGTRYSIQRSQLMLEGSMLALETLKSKINELKEDK